MTTGQLLHTDQIAGPEREDTTTWKQVGPDLVEVWEDTLYPATASVSRLARTITLAEAHAEIAKLGH